MSTSPTLEYATIVQTIRSWPPAQRVRLLQDVLQTLVPLETGAPLQRSTLPQALGLLKTDQPPPSDAEVAQWLDEHRTERYER